ncbi:MAG: STAS domain-containing protein [Kiritimatiellae bacterium]|nr:STAS domain-containing protein [Kiritimatiellia bacterium]
MNDNPSTNHVLEVARQGATAYLRVLGRATFTVGPALKQFGTASIEEGCTRMVLDVSACEGMDSTFMGVLAGMATRLARQTGGKMLMLNVNYKLFEILRTLGLDQLMECRRLGAVTEPLVKPPLTAQALSPIAAAAADRQTTQRVMLEAHTTLAAVSADNQLRFKDVLTYLREDVKPDNGRSRPPGE